VTARSAREQKYDYHNNVNYIAIGVFDRRQKRAQPDEESSNSKAAGGSAKRRFTGNSPRKMQFQSITQK
jgi:hypothetical protein